MTVEMPIESLQRENAELRAEILHLKEQIAWFTRHIFREAVRAHPKALCHRGNGLAVAPSRKISTSTTQSTPYHRYSH